MEEKNNQIKVLTGHLEVKDFLIAQLKQELSVAIETRPCDPSQIPRDQVTQSTQTDKDIAVANRNAPIDNKVQNITSSPSLAHDCAILSDKMNPGDTSSTSANAPPPTLVEKSDVRTRKYNMLCRFFEQGFCRLKKVSVFAYMLKFLIKMLQQK